MADLVGISLTVVSQILRFEIPDTASFKWRHTQCCRVLSTWGVHTLMFFHMLCHVVHRSLCLCRLFLSVGSCSCCERLLEIILFFEISRNGGRVFGTGFTRLGLLSILSSPVGFGLARYCSMQAVVWVCYLRHGCGPAGFKEWIKGWAVLGNISEVIAGVPRSVIRRLISYNNTGWGRTNRSILVGLQLRRVKWAQAAYCFLY